MTEHICLEGPFEIEMKVGITNGENVGTITYGMGHGTTPTAAAIQAGIAKCSQEAAKQGFRLMDRREYIQDALGLSGVAIPGPWKFPNT